ETGMVLSIETHAPKVRADYSLGPFASAQALILLAPSALKNRSRDPLLNSLRRRFQSRGMRAATMKHPPAASIESTVIVIARGLGSRSFAAARDQWSMIEPNVPTYICTSR